MEALREFTSAAEMMAFYRDLHARMAALGPRPPAPPAEPPYSPPHVGLTPIQRIIVAVTQEFGLPVHVLRCRSRGRHIVIPRQVVVFLAKELTGMSNGAI